MKDSLKMILIVLISIYLAGLLSIYLLQEKFIFIPDLLPQSYIYDFSGEFDELYFDTKDGGRLNALLFKVEESNGVILYYHGNAGSLASWGSVVQKFTELQYDVLVMDYRKYGKSTGKLGEEALYSDAQIFYDYVSDTYDEAKILVYGRSLGTAFATYVAANNKPKALILEAPFYSVEKVAKTRFPIYPVSWLLKYKFPTYKHIKEVDCPITIIHGEQDQVVSYENSVALSKLVDKENLNFVSIPEANHNDLAETGIYKETLQDILKTASSKNQEIRL